MNIAILHYHLNPGVVTSVIADQLRALDAATDEPMRVVLVHGGDAAGWDESLVERLSNVELSQCVVPELGDDGNEFVEAQPGLLAGRLFERLDDIGCAAGDTVLHIHNHTVAKNASLPGAIGLLLLGGYRLLLQIHDFAEDGRPAVYRRLRQSLMARDPAELSAILYPQGARVHYAVGNGRDASILQGAGFDESRLHLLPNPVAELTGLPPYAAARRRIARLFGVTESERLLLMPMRCDRRRNLGEALLWSALFPESVAIGFTLPPLNPAEQPSYQHWKELAKTLDLRCVFEMGTSESGSSFADNLAAADAVLTTSVAESFGLAFLETWFAGCPLVGRDLPELTADFKAAGMTFDHLQPELLIPTDDAFATEFRARFADEFRRSLNEYVKNEELLNELPAEDAAALQNGHIDFARLDSELQQRVIERTANEPGFRERILSRNAWMRSAVVASRDSRIETMTRNANIVRQEYSLEGCGGRLLDIYRGLLSAADESDTETLSDGGRILGEFLSPSRFIPISAEN